MLGRFVVVLSALGFAVHAEERVLRLDSLETMLQGGKSGPAIVPGKPDESLLVQAFTCKQCRFSGCSSRAQVHFIAKPESAMGCTQGPRKCAYRTVN